MFRSQMKRQVGEHGERLDRAVASLARATSALEKLGTRVDEVRRIVDEFVPFICARCERLCQPSQRGSLSSQKPVCDDCSGVLETQIAADEWGEYDAIFGEFRR